MLIYTFYKYSSHIGNALHQEITGEKKRLVIFINFQDSTIKFTKTSDLHGGLPVLGPSADSSWEISFIADLPIVIVIQVPTRLNFYPT